MDEDDDILDVNGIAALLKCKKSWVYRSAREYGLPLRKIGGKGLRASRNEVVDWFKQQPFAE